MSGYLSNKEKKELIKLIKDVDINDEDSVYDLGVELCRWSVKLRASIIKEE